MLIFCVLETSGQSFQIVCNSGRSSLQELTAYIEAWSQYCLNPNCHNFCLQNIICASSIRLLNLCKVPGDCSKTLGGTEYTNLLPFIETLFQNDLSCKCCNFVFFFLSAKSHICEVSNRLLEDLRSSLHKLATLYWSLFFEISK